MSDRDALPAFPLKREARAKLPAQAAALLNSEIEKWAKVVKATGVRVD